MSPEAHPQLVTPNPLACPSCGRSDRWRGELEVSGSTDIYEMNSAGRFDLVHCSCELYEKTYSCLGCGLELDWDDHENLIDGLDELRGET